MRLPALHVFPLFFAVLFPALVSAQDVAPDLPEPVDTVTVVTDTLFSPPPDSAEVDPLPVEPVRSGLRQSDGAAGSVTFAARDSIVIVLNDDDEDVASLFGESTVVFGDARLEAYTIDLFFEQEELRARGLESDSGLVGMPQFRQGSESFSGTRLAYNMRTDRGRIEEARTAIQDGFVRAGIVTVTEDTTLFIRHGVYTTCDCVDDPSYSLRSGKMKIVDQEWIYTGPIQLYLFNIPTPLWLPFGFLPATEGRRSGPLPPRYGEDDRGFYLRDWGWYWAINDYMDAQIQAGFWSRGSWSIRPTYRYNRRGAFSGNLTFDFVRNRSGESRDPDFQVFDTASLRWNHNQTLNPTATLSGDVNLSSTSYMRAISEQYVDQEWIYTGPIQLYLFNIPTPLWLPFGFLPATEGRRSGPLPPRYGEDDRGFYLRDWGWYWAINDYMDAQIQAGFWSRGSWSIRPTYRYNRRGAFSGNLTFDFVRNRSGESRDPDFQVFDTASLRWNHNQTLNPTATLSGDVNLSSTSYMRAISEQYDDRVRQSISSTIRYSKRWPSAGRSFNMSLTQSQNLATGNANLTLPSLSFTQSSRKPFQGSSAVPSEENWFQRITMSYSGRLDNRFDFSPLPDSTREQLGVGDVEWYHALFSPSDYRLATGQETPFRITATHSIPVSSNFSINRIPGLARTFRLNVSQNLNYTENWYTESERREYDESLGRVVSSRESGFVSVRRYNVGASANTTFYGLFPMRLGNFEGLRHTVRPAASFSFSPDFTSDFWGYTRTYRDEDGREVRYPIVSGITSKQQTLSFRVDNVFETKVVSTDDDGEVRSRTLKLLDLGLNSSYNFAADSLKMSPVNVNARTRILDQVDIRADASFSPYWRDPITGREQSRYLFRERPWWPLRMTRVSVSLNTAFRSGATGSSRPFESPRVNPGDMMMNGMAGLDGMPITDEMNVANPSRAADLLSGVRYADFAIPWSLNLDMNYNLSRLSTSTTRRAIINASFDFNLTPNWKAQGRTGYDLIQEEVVLTNLVVMRDFECWQLSVNWTPFGPYQSWGFDLHVKSGHLRDILRLRQPRQDVQGRFGGRLSSGF